MIYRFWGKVSKYKQRGRSLGFPTANINLKQNIPEGVYISESKIQKHLYPSLTFIGAAKTFNEKEVRAENYILDFDRNIYHKWISIKLIKKIRNNHKFDSAQELIKQMREDEKQAREYFKLT